MCAPNLGRLYMIRYYSHYLSWLFLKGSNIISIIIRITLYCGSIELITSR